ncbi:CopY/TcrY family copper transport repressor [Geosporobacter ferrireducens]|uniref:CopY/TcrY family copper transport repressor n=1 Tax=Geosporobacter ferrireducens TaxID=1424294 RepID=UPI00139D1A64|nr:CopY/TcrY family copper transport repressor [Geosporobacter ferrireducens]MTI56620.1 CopY/TcrY family copper transport repressor [Geosporobacter ferrireducens]
MQLFPKISDAEWEVMKIIWRGNRITSEEIIISLSEKMDWSAPTVKTFINRLHKKGVIGFEKSGRNYIYYPLVSEKDCIRTERKSFVEKVYDGAVSMLFSNFIEEEPLSDQEIERLQKLLEEKKTQRKK